MSHKKPVTFMARSRLLNRWQRSQWFMATENNRNKLILLGFLSIWLGLEFYLSCRDIGQLPWFPEWLRALALPWQWQGAQGFVWRTAPTFLHVLGFSLLSAAWIKPTRAAGLWIGANLVWELATGFHADDIAVSFVAGLIAVVVAQREEHGVS